MCGLAHRSINACMIFQKWVCLESLDLLKFWEISDNISETVQDKDTVAVEDNIGNRMWLIE